MNIYVIKQYTVSEITDLYKLIDSKNKIIKNIIIIWTKEPNPHMPKTQSNVQPMSI